MTTRFTRVVQLIILVGLMFVTILFIAFLSGNKTANGSVAFGNDYQATTTDATWTTLTPKILLSKGGSLGSVIVTTIGTGSLTLYDATTTDNTLRASVATSTITVANWQITTSLGTYTFDTSFKNGLIAVWVGTNDATTTI